MAHYAYNAFLRYSGTVENEDDCPAGCELTAEPLPAEPWPPGSWPYFMADGWELAEVQH